MRVLVIGGTEDRRGWVSAFRCLAGVEVVGFDAAEGLSGYKEGEVAGRFAEAVETERAAAVCVAVERKYRARLAADALVGGLHVIVEPPLGETDDEAREVIEASKKSGALLMVAHEGVFRPGVLRLISLLNRGDIGRPLEAAIVLGDFEGMRRDIVRLDTDARAYHREWLLWSSRVCLAGKIAGADGFDSAEVTGYSLGSGVKLELWMRGVRVRFDVKDSMRLAQAEFSEMKGAGITLPPDVLIHERIWVRGESGELSYVRTPDSEIVVMEAGGRKRYARLAGVDARAAMAGYFREFMEKGIKPFVGGEAAAAADSGARGILDLVLRRRYRDQLERSCEAAMPELLKGLEKTAVSAGAEFRLFSYEKYRERFDWRPAGGFRLCLLGAPGAGTVEDYRDNMLFPPFSISVLGGIAARHGCEVVIDDLSRFALRPGVLSNDEIGSIWPSGGGDRRRDEVLSCAARRVADELKPESFDLIGMSMQQSCHREFVFALCREIKKRTSAPVAIGGTLDFDVGEAAACADYVVSGEGEIPLLALIRSVSEGRPPEDVPNLLHPLPADSMPANVISDIRIRGIPMYAPELMELYSRDGMTIYPYIFVNGCPHKCAFCANYAPYKARILAIREVIGNIEQIAKEYGARRFFFLNHLINFNVKYLREFTDGLLAAKLDILWSDCGCLSGLDKPTLEKMRAAGCRKITWGLDTGSERLIKLNRKPVNIEEAEAILRRSHEAGIYNVVNLITGLPHETRADVEETIGFLERNKKYISRVFSPSFEYAPASPIFTEPEKYGLIKKGDTFDEIGGLKWAAKLEQDAENRVIVEDYLASIRDGIGMTEWEMMSE